jgi:hypothetical protein
MDFAIPTQGLPQRQGRHPQERPLLGMQEICGGKRMKREPGTRTSLLLPGGRLDLQLLFQEGEEGAGV